MDILNKIFSKIRGAYFAFLTLIAVGFGIFVGLIIYLPIDPAFSILFNYISDIGAGPIGSRIVFGIGMILGAIFMIFLNLYISRYLQRKRENYRLILGFQASGIYAVLGLILIGIFPLDRAIVYAYLMHCIAAIVFFSFIAISNFYLGYIEYKNKEFSLILSIFSYLTAIFSAIFIVGFIIQELGLIYPHPFVYLTEWGFLGFVTIWLIVHGIYFLKRKE